MKPLIGIWLASLFLNAGAAQATQISVDSFSVYFREVQEVTKEHATLWNRDIYGPILMVDPETREVYANMADEGGVLYLSEGIYRGMLPKEITISNTDAHWSGTHWAMIKLPLPPLKQDRIDLITHELFHVAQPSLGFELQREDNIHLDDKEGRIYLRLEMAALKEALLARRLAQAEEHLRNALIFRRYRQLLFRGSEISENSLELLEGLATYTGQMMSGRDKWELRNYLITRIVAFENFPSYVRAFAYETVPVYGFFLYQKDNHWNKEIDMESDLTTFFADAFGMDMRIILQRYVKQVADEYNGRAIVDEEQKRDISNNARLDLYREKFLEDPHLEIRLGEISISFDFLNVVPLDEDEGMVYFTLQISDQWGILTVDGGGALLRSDWRWVIVAEPLEIEGDRVIGEGWNIVLNEGFFIEKTITGDYMLSRKK
ncbi:MAG: hypothetical protein WCR50_03390 [Proteiniphilum sp.]|mgnify:FL=1|nr:hypothetical protein [Proteiniphilum sp.]NCB24824.1 hypothetical protein [Bacteroidia bacterium]